MCYCNRDALDLRPPVFWYVLQSIALDYFSNCACQHQHGFSFTALIREDCIQYKKTLYLLKNPVHRTKFRQLWEKWNRNLKAVKKIWFTLLSTEWKRVFELHSVKCVRKNGFYWCTILQRCIPSNQLITHTWLTWPFPGRKNSANLAIHSFWKRNIF